MWSPGSKPDEIPPKQGFRIIAYQAAFPRTNQALLHNAFRVSGSTLDPELVGSRFLAEKTPSHTKDNQSKVWHGKGPVLEAREWKTGGIQAILNELSYAVNPSRRRWLAAKEFIPRPSLGSSSNRKHSRLLEVSGNGVIPRPADRATVKPGVDFHTRRFCSRWGCSGCWERQCRHVIHIGLGSGVQNCNGRSGRCSSLQDRRPIACTQYANTRGTTANSELFSGQGNGGWVVSCPSVPGEGVF